MRSSGAQAAAWLIPAELMRRLSHGALGPGRGTGAIPHKPVRFSDLKICRKASCMATDGNHIENGSAPELFPWAFSRPAPSVRIRCAANPCSAMFPTGVRRSGALKQSVLDEEEKKDKASTATPSRALILNLHDSMYSLPDSAKRLG
jgi:hypothetical protein